MLHFRRGLLLIAIPLWLAVGLGANPPSGPERVDPADWAEGWARISNGTFGFVVWESNRSGRWRIWSRRLDGSDLRQLSADEEERDHAAAHISPDGRHVVYLSMAAPVQSFRSMRGEPAPMHIVRLGRGGPAEVLERRVLVPDARPYFQHRAAVWVDNRSLLYIAGDGTTRQIDIHSGEEEVVIAAERDKFGWLLNATRTHATGGWPTFSPYEAEDRSVLSRQRHRGCQPYFTRDGRYGFWVAGSGGPFQRIDLASGEIETILARRSDRMPADRAYVYYPMVSADQRLLAFGASRDEHGHFDKDFEIFVSLIDPGTLHPVGDPVRYSFDKGQDRFPDAFLSGLELGRRLGEMPLRVELALPDGEAEGDFEWELGDGTRTRGRTAHHIYRKPGTYAVIARRGAQVYGGEVVVRPPDRPDPLRVELRKAGRQIAVVFDEPIRAEGAQASLASGAEVKNVFASGDGRALVVSLVAPLPKSDVLNLAGVTDQADQANTMRPVELEVDVAPWPGNRRGLAYLFETADKPNLAGERSYEILPRGRARIDGHFALRVDGGHFEVAGLGPKFSKRFRSAQALTIEATITPRLEQQRGPANIISLSGGRKERNFSLGHHGRFLVARVRTPKTGTDANHPEVHLFSLTPGEPNHVIVSYTQGRLVAYHNGVKVLATDEIAGGFRNWGDDYTLYIGAEPGVDRDWQGTVEGVAIYSRFMKSREAAAHAGRYAALLAAREPIPQRTVVARLDAASALPTLEQIAPYREALVINEYTLQESGERVRVAEWAILDGDTQVASSRRVGEQRELTLEPIERNPQVEGVYLSDTLDDDFDTRVYLDVSG